MLRLKEMKRRILEPNSLLEICGMFARHGLYGADSSCIKWRVRSNEALIFTLCQEGGIFYNQRLITIDMAGPGQLASLASTD